MYYHYKNKINSSGCLACEAGIPSYKLTMHKKYVLQSGNLFLEKTYHYGYTMGNQPVFEATFTEEITKAQLFDKDEAFRKIKKFKEEEFVVRNKIEINSVEVKEVVISLKQK